MASTPRHKNSLREHIPLSYAPSPVVHSLQLGAAICCMSSSGRVSSRRNVSTHKSQSQTLTAAMRNQPLQHVAGPRPSIVQLAGGARDQHLRPKVCPKHCFARFMEPAQTRRIRPLLGWKTVHRLRALPSAKKTRVDFPPLIVTQMLCAVLCPTRSPPLLAGRRAVAARRGMSVLG